MPDGVKVHPGDQRQREKPAASAIDNRFEMVIVKRSLDAAKAISAGKERAI